MANHTIKVWLKMMKEQNIPQDSLIAGYLPADYCDSFSRNVVSEKAITSDEFFDMAFNHSPAWVNGLHRRLFSVCPINKECKRRKRENKGN